MTSRPSLMMLDTTLGRLMESNNVIIKRIIFTINFGTIVEQLTFLSNLILWKYK
jgi:hypothetical protein